MGQPGSDIDDGFALALAVAEPDLALELVTTVNGNTHVDNATRLTVDLLHRLHHRVPVVRGSDRPLLRSSPASPPGVPRFDPPATGSRDHSSHAAVELGHTGVAAMPGEFNFWVDPDAAAVVLDSGAPLRLVGLDVTRRVRLDRADAAALRRTGRDFAAFAADCTDEWIDHLERTSPGDDWDRGSCALHDPLAVAVVARPDLVTWRPARVTVEGSSDRTRGVAVTDLLGSDGAPSANCVIAVDVDAEAFRSYFLDRIGTLP
jgi:purine nucleosidase